MCVCGGQKQPRSLRGGRRCCIACDHNVILKCHKQCNWRCEITLWPCGAPRPSSRFALAGISAHTSTPPDLLSALCHGSKRILLALSPARRPPAGPCRYARPNAPAQDKAREPDQHDTDCGAGGESGRVGGRETASCPMKAGRIRWLALLRVVCTSMFRLRLHPLLLAPSIDLYCPGGAAGG